MNLLTGQRMWAIGIAVLGMALPAIAAEPKKKPAAPESAVPASLRLWKGDFSSQRPVRITRRGSARKGSTPEWSEVAEGYRFGDYSQVPAGACTLEVTDVKEPKNRLASITTSLAPGSFFTLLVQEKQGVVVAELLADTAPNGEVAELIVRNFDPTLKSIQIDAGPDLHARVTSPESYLQVRGLPRARLQIETTGEDGSGQSLKWSNDVNFKKFRRATMLIYPDSYGRIRPRVVVDGEAIAAHPEEAPETPPAK